MDGLIESYYTISNYLPAIGKQQDTKTADDENSQVAEGNEPRKKKKKKKKKEKPKSWFPFFGSKNDKDKDKDKDKKSGKSVKNTNGDNAEEDEEEGDEEEDAAKGTSLTKADYGPPYYTQDNPRGHLELLEVVSKVPIKLVQVHLLLNERVNPNLIDPEDPMRYTALHWCARSYNVPAMKMLYKAKITSNPLSILYQTPLVLACLVKQKPVSERRKLQLNAVKYLLEQGASVNIRDKGGFTVLDYAAMNDDVEIVKILLSYGAKVREVNKYFSVKQAHVFDLMKSSENSEIPGLAHETIEEIKAENEDLEYTMQEYSKANHTTYDDFNSLASTNGGDLQGMSKEQSEIDKNINKTFKSRCFDLINDKVKAQNIIIEERLKKEAEELAIFEAQQKKIKTDEEKEERRRMRAITLYKKRKHNMKALSKNWVQNNLPKILSQNLSRSTPLNLSIQEPPTIDYNTTNNNKSAATIGVGKMILPMLDLNGKGTAKPGTAPSNTNTNAKNTSTSMISKPQPIDVRTFKPTADPEVEKVHIGWEKIKSTTNDNDNSTNNIQWKEVLGNKNNSMVLKTHNSDNNNQPTSMVFDGGWNRIYEMASIEMNALRLRDEGARDVNIRTQWKELTGGHDIEEPIRRKKY